MRRRAIEIVVELLDVLTVIAFAVGEPEQALLEDRVAPVPQCHRETQPLLVVREPRDAILTPAVSTAARLIVREVVPRVAVGAVILTHRSPLAFGEIRAPGLPAFALGKPRLQACVLGTTGRHGHLNLQPLGLPWCARVARSGCDRPGEFQQRSRPERSSRVANEARRRP